MNYGHLAAFLDQYGLQDPLVFRFYEKWMEFTELQF